MENKQKNIHIFALAAAGLGISGGDRIFIEFARRWSKTSQVEIYVWEEGYQMCQRQGLIVSSIKYRVLMMNPWKYFGFIINYIARIVEGVRVGLTLHLKNSPKTVVYSASEFWMDSLPAFLLKLKYPKIIWVAAWFQTAPNPLIGFSEGGRSNRYRLRSLAYFLIQLPIKPLISRFTNFVLVNNDEEKKQFPNLDRQGRVVVVLGAVNTKDIEKWRGKFKNLPKVYEAVFQGRFHPQKGVMELVDIWKLVVEKKRNSKLIMIGDGPLMKSVKLKVKNEKLEKNIILRGYLFDGEEKYQIFSQSRVVVHPAFYDSGGMASLEAMAFGLPAVGFDLKSFKSYYPKGMVKVKIGDIEAFAKCIVELLDDNRERIKLGKEAQDLIDQNWSWDKRAKEILSKIDNIL